MILTHKIITSIIIGLVIVITNGCLMRICHMQLLIEAQHVSTIIVECAVVITVERTIIITDGCTICIYHYW